MNQTSKKISNSILWSVMERLSSQGMYFLVSIVLTRLIMPEEYGIVTIVTVFVNLCGVVVQSGFSSALIYYDGDDIACYSTAFWATLGITGSIYILMFLLAPSIAKFYEIPSLMLYIRVMSMQFVFQGIQSIPFAYVSKHMMFRKNYIATFIGVFVSAVVAIVLAINGLGVWALITITSIEVIVATIILLITINFKIVFKFDIRIFKAMFKYCWRLVVVDSLNSLYSSLNSMIIGKRFSTADVAYYNKAYNLPQTMFGSVNTAISKVLFPVFAEKNITDSVRIKMLRRSIRTINYVMFPMLLGLATVAPSFIIVLFTETWREVIFYLQIMCLVWMFQPIQTCAIQIFKGVGVNSIYLKIEIIKKIISLLILILSILVFNSAIGIAWALLASQIVSTVINIPVMNKYLKYSYRDQIKDGCSSLLLCMLMMIAAHLVGVLITNLILKLIVQVMVGSATYLLISFFTKNEQFIYIYSVLVLPRLSKYKNK